MSDTTIAEVADKTVDHIANGVQQIAGAVEKLAPGAWDVAVRQQRSEGIVDLVIGAVTLAAVTAGYLFLWHRTSATDNKEEREFSRGFGGVVGLVFLGISVLSFIKPGFLQWQYPEYYAAQSIAAMVHR